MLSRMLIVDHLDGVFDRQPVTRTDLLDHARDRGAPAEVLQSLAALPDEWFHRMVDLWPHLPGLPVEG